MSQQPNLQDFPYLQAEYYEEKNSDPLHFLLKTYDYDDMLGFQVEFQLSEQHKQNLALDFQLELQPLFSEGEHSNEPSKNPENPTEDQENSFGIDAPSINHQIESQSASDSKTNESNTNQLSSNNSKKSKKRQDNNNNAHKFFTTMLNETCKDCGIRKSLKKTLKQRKIAFNKASRQAFIIRLLQISLVFPKGSEIIQQIFLKKLEKSFNQNKNDKASLYLKGLKQVYQKAIELFYLGKVIEATECIYQIENAKEKQYKMNGIHKVEDFMKRYRYQ